MTISAAVSAVADAIAASSFFRGERQTPLNVSAKSVLQFQALDWVDANDGKEIRVPGGAGAAGAAGAAAAASGGKGNNTNTNSKKTVREYQIRVFGVTLQGNAVCIKINGFLPYFFVRLADHTRAPECKAFFSWLRSNECKLVPREYRGCLLSFQYVRKPVLMGFENGETHPFMKLSFNNTDAMRVYQRKMIDLLKLGGMSPSESGGDKVGRVYEGKLDPILRYMHLHELTPCGWIEIDGDDLIPISSAPDASPFFYSAKSSCLKPCPERGMELAPIVQASYDIEVYSVDNTFPKPEIAGNTITQIATCFKIHGQPGFLLKHIITLKDCSPIASPDADGVPIIVESYTTEKQVLLAWSKLIQGMDPDILYQYNGDQFDAHYLVTRAEHRGCQSLFLSKLSRLASKMPCSLNAASFGSSAYGKTEFQRLTIPGRIHFDLLVYFKRELKETSYSLNAMSQKYLAGAKKNDMTPNEMFAFFREGHPDKIKELAEYCIQDTLLPQRLADKFHILENHISMANVSRVPFSFLIFKGQQIKAYSQILYVCRHRGLLVEDALSVPKLLPERETDDDAGGDADNKEKFKGATVLAPMTGAYFDPIATLDFASLYPSIIRRHGLCYSSIVLDDEKYGAIPGVQYEVVEWNDDDNDDDNTKDNTTAKEETEGTGGNGGNGGNGGKVYQHRVKYAQGIPTVIPSILAELAKSRSAAKKLMAQQTDPFQEIVYDKLQLAYKLCMNSMYGFLAAHMIPCKPIAATVTTLGRRMIQATKKYVETHYDASVVVYGDSVPGYTPIVVTDSSSSSKPYVTRIDKLVPERFFHSRQRPFIDGDGYVNVNVGGGGGKEEGKQEVVFETDRFRVWTQHGLAGIRRIIRHRTNKKIYRVATKRGIVEVTEDHSLLSESGSLIRPADVQPGKTRLLRGNALSFS